MSGFSRKVVHDRYDAASSTYRVCVLILSVLLLMLAAFSSVNYFICNTILIVGIALLVEFIDDIFCC